MEEEEIETYLKALGEELERQGITQPIRILVVGGVFMVCAMKSRDATEDIDAILLDLPELTDKPPIEIIKKFIRAKNAVAKRFEIPRKWFNDSVKEFLLDYAPNPPFSLWKTFQMLHVFFPPKEYVLASKLMTFRLKDYDDVEALLQDVGIETREQAQALVDRFVPDKRWQEHYELSKNLDTLF
ncbi:hypothetical protein KSF_108420 [Reticulibacter mediterranei]|uniref:Nucleotidyltransferase n=1 Tax=Reticulibacter mediterranei TaxID=2778369 RepID=A0A8J3N738_9CHLR|nr:hypothetical protein [Reticulibacter mediterranei]GHP00795.1 hypothetical protein KSF_108420 [Reticulibacter mediterranei]